MLQKLPEKKCFHNWYFHKYLSKISSQHRRRQKSSLKLYNRYWAAIYQLAPSIHSILDLPSDRSHKPVMFPLEVYLSAVQINVFSISSQCDLVGLWIEHGWRSAVKNLGTLDIELNSAQAILWLYELNLYSFFLLEVTCRLCPLVLILNTLLHKIFLFWGSDSVL